MSQVRTTLVQYEQLHNRFLSTLDSLEMWVKSDSTIMARWDSLFPAGLNPDSLIYSPRTGSKFGYALNDTSRTSTYLLEDPDSDDHIGTTSGDVTQKNAESWN